MNPNSSGSRPARASRLGARAALVACLLASGAYAQSEHEAGAASAPVIVVDLERALRDSRAASALREEEVRARRALRAKLDAIQAALEAEEAEMVILRETLAKEAFDDRVRSFDQRVRAARRGAQEEAAALQARFATAQSALQAATVPLIEALMHERGAVLVIDRRTALGVAPGLDATDALIARLDARDQPSAAPQGPQRP